MSKATNPFQRYFQQTNTLLYSYLISLPLLLLYEILIIVAQPDASQVVRISVDVWIKTMFSYLGTDVVSITLLLVGLVGMVILYRERHRLSSLKAHYFMLMLLEATAYALFLALLISAIVSNIMLMVQSGPMDALSTLQQLALSLGAGLYEELFFRVILVSVLLYLFKYLFSKTWVAFTSAVVVAALIFSWVHYIGALGDPFSTASFLFRFLFGLALNMVYLWRGFGMAAWTHAIYDLMVIATL